MSLCYSAGVCQGKAVCRPAGEDLEECLLLQELNSSRGRDTQSQDIMGVDIETLQVRELSVIFCTVLGRLLKRSQ